MGASVGSKGDFKEVMKCLEWKQSSSKSRGGLDREGDSQKVLVLETTNENS